MNLDKLKICLSYKDFNLRQLAVFIMLKRPMGKHLKFREIAREIGIPNATLSRAFDGLEKLGLIERKLGKDKRDIHGILTQKGRELAERISS